MKERANAVGDPVEVPAWAAALWFLGPYGFAAAVVATTPTTTTASAAADLALIAGLMLEQVAVVYWCPRLGSAAGVASVAAALISLWLWASRLSCGPIRSMLTMELCMNGFFRQMQLLSSSRLRRRSFAHRLAFVTIFHDVDTAARWEPASQPIRKATSVACRDLVASLAAAVATGLCLRHTLPPAPPLTPSLPIWMLILRTTCGIVFIYAALTLIDTAYRVSLLMVRPRAIVCAPAMDAPYLAESFAEFWSKRWDRPMQGILFHGVFLPCKKMLGLGTPACVFLTFFVSGAVHTLGLAVSGWVSWASCAMMLSFFMAHAVLTLGEAACFSRRTQNVRPDGERCGHRNNATTDNRRGCGWAMTTFLCFLSAPLFVIPFLELIQL